LGIGGPFDALVQSGFDAVFVSMPWAYNVGLGWVVLLRTDGAILRDRLNHALHDASLADRSGAMRTAIVPCKKFAIDLENTDL
jgi:hypothetical protein